MSKSHQLWEIFGLCVVLIGFGGIMIVAPIQLADASGITEFHEPPSVVIGEYNETEQEYTITYAGNSIEDTEYVYLKSEVTVEYGDTKTTWNGKTRGDALQQGSTHTIDLSDKSIETVTVTFSHPEFETDSVYKLEV